MSGAGASDIKDLAVGRAESMSEGTAETAGGGALALDRARESDGAPAPVCSPGSGCAAGAELAAVPVPETPAPGTPASEGAGTYTAVPRFFAAAASVESDGTRISVSGPYSDSSAWGSM